MEKYLYFRTQATAGNDDASDDSCMFPLYHLCGMVPYADDTLNIYFKPMIKQAMNRFDHDGDSTSTVNSDYVVVTLSSNNTHKDVIADLSALFAAVGSTKEGFISVADDLTSTYAVNGIAGLSTISIQAAVATAGA